MAPLHRFLSLAGALLLATSALAQDRAITYNLYGAPGLLEMPSALSADDGEIAGTFGYFDGHIRTSFSFQITPRLSGTFRYGGVKDYFEETEETEDGDLWDRSFDLRYRLLDEGRFTPAVTVGLQDFLGTGINSAEYVVATKTVGSSVRVTAGLGWGRLGTHNGFDNPLGRVSDAFLTRPEEFVGGEDLGGVPNYEAWFRGDAALFGGVEWAPSPRWILKAEYSSDDGYVNAAGEPLFERASPFNFGVTWRPRPGIQLGLGYLYGSELSFGATVTVNPNQRPFFTGLDPAPVPVAVRAAGGADWDRLSALPEPALRDRLAQALRPEGIGLLAVEIGPASARLRYSNNRWRTQAQAMGRILRVLSAELPPGIETITLEPVERGIPLSAATFARSDVEALENEVGGTAAALSRVRLTDAGPSAGLVELPPRSDAFSWSLRPTLTYTLFNPGDPISFALAAELSATYRIQPNLVLSGAIRQRIWPRPGDGEPDPVEPLGGWPVVRRDGGFYGRDGGPTLERLTLSWFSRPGRDFYGRVTAGYLEGMYGGVSTELLWKPVRSRVGLGVELNYAVKRDYDRGLGFQDYDVVTGHVSAYLDPGDGFHYRVDVGRYLAGDWGATLAVDREFENGWSVGGYVTLTEVPFEDYGEGSFDKGLRVTIPLDFILGRPTQRERSVTLQSLSRDGGARLRVSDRLYEVVRDGHFADLEDSWGRFWR